MSTQAIRQRSLTRMIAQDSRGHTMAEMGFLLLPFLLLLLAVIEFGWFYLHEHTLQYATREGMRMALVGGILTDGQGQPLSREDSIVETIKQSAAWIMEIPDDHIHIFLVGNNYENPDGWETAAPNAGNPADYMRVVVDYEHTFLTPLIGGFFSDDGRFTLRAQGTYRNELFETGV